MFSSNNYNNNTMQAEVEEDLVNQECRNILTESEQQKPVPRKEKIIIAKRLD